MSLRENFAFSLIAGILVLGLPALMVLTRVIAG